MAISAGVLRGAKIKVPSGETHARCVQFRRNGKVVASASKPAQLQDFLKKHKGCEIIVKWCDQALQH